MPRQARLDSPGTLHDVIVRGINKRGIVDDEEDRQDFVRRRVTAQVRAEIARRLVEDYGLTWPR